jgi:hypothetical protein
VLQSFQLDRRGVREVLQSPEVRAMVDEVALNLQVRVRAALPPGTQVKVKRYTTDRDSASVTIADVMVRKDSDVPHSSMANARVTLRVTCWHEDDDQAHDLAMLCQGLLLVHSGPVIRGVRPGTGPLPAVDDVSGVPLSTFTVLANVRPRLA